MCLIGRQWLTQQRMNLCIALSVVRVLLQQYASNGNEQNNHKSGFGRHTKETLQNLCRVIRNNRLREKGKKKTHNSSEGTPGQFGQVSSEIRYLSVSAYL
jgi:hypothetical protein